MGAHVIGQAFPGNAESPSLSDAAVFFVTSAITERGSGPSPSFLYSGRLLRAGDAPCCRIVAHSATEDDARSRRDGGRFHLYISYEEPSPKAKRCRPEPSAFRAELSDCAQSMLCCLRHLPQEVCVDRSLGLVRWGHSVAIAFSSRSMLERFVQGLRRCTPVSCCLDSEPAAALLRALPCSEGDGPPRCCGERASSADLAAQNTALASAVAV